MRGMGELLDAAQELALIGIWEVDLATGETLWSTGLERVLGTEPVPGVRDYQEFVHYVHPGDRDEVGAILETVAERPEEFPPEGATVDCRVVRPDGEIREIRARGTIERDPSGEPARWQCTLQDVTDLRLGERELEAH